LKRSLTFLLGLAVSALAGAQAMQALTVTQTGTFTNDNQVFQYNFTLPTASSISIFTTSYGGGTNLDGTVSTAGGFVPNLTLFTASGNVIAGDGGSAMARGNLRMDPSTRLYNDAFIATSLTAGSYILTLTEFPNVAIGNFSDGFLFASSPTATGDTCGVSGGKFLEVDTVPCAPISAAFAVNVNTPEPATAFLVVPALGVAYFLRRRRAINA
jgi:hypothetical protein